MFQQDRHGCSRRSSICTIATWITGGDMGLGNATTQLGMPPHGAMVLRCSAWLGFMRNAIMKLTSITSSNLIALGYDPVNKKLRVQFKGSGDKNGKVFEYADVTPEKYAEMRAAPSVGGYFSSMVRSHHPAKEIK